MTWICNIGGIHLVNQSGTPLAGGSPYLWSDTPFAVREGWMFDASDPDIEQRGSKLFQLGAPVANIGYNNITTTIPISVLGTTIDNAGQRLQDLKRVLSKAHPRRPVFWQMMPHGATNVIYGEIYSGHVVERLTDNKSPIEGFYDIEAEIKVVSTPFFGSKDLVTAASAAAIGNTSTGTPDNTIAFGPLDGDLIYEGQPLVIQFNKPASQAAARVIITSVVKAVKATINNPVTTVLTTGTNFTASGDIDVSELRLYDGVSIRVLARLKSTITNPSKIQIMATIQTSSGNTLWIGPWIDINTNTTAQLVDLRGSYLDAIRIPINATQMIKVQCAIRSVDGASVTATLDYIDVLLAYDELAIIEASGGIGSGQSYWCFGAQNLSDGGWLPVTSVDAVVVDANGLVVKPAGVSGALPRARADASLYVAWQASDGLHTSTDTTTITIQYAPLWRSLRGMT